MRKQNKENQAMQKGERRQRLKDNQNDKGNSNTPSGYKTFDGKDI